MSNALQVFSSSFREVHACGRSRRSASRVGGVRARSCTVWSKLCSIMLPQFVAGNFRENRYARSYFKVSTGSSVGISLHGLTYPLAGSRFAEYHLQEADNVT